MVYSLTQPDQLQIKQSSMQGTCCASIVDRLWSTSSFLPVTSTYARTISGQQDCLPLTQAGDIANKALSLEAAAAGPAKAHQVKDVCVVVEQCACRHVCPKTRPALCVEGLIEVSLTCIKAGATQHYGPGQAHGTTDAQENQGPGLQLQSLCWTQECSQHGHAGDCVACSACCVTALARLRLWPDCAVAELHHRLAAVYCPCRRSHRGCAFRAR